MADGIEDIIVILSVFVLLLVGLGFLYNVLSVDGKKEAYLLYAVDEEDRFISSLPSKSNFTLNVIVGGNVPETTAGFLYFLVGYRSSTISEDNGSTLFSNFTILCTRSLHVSDSNYSKVSFDMFVDNADKKISVVDGTVTKEVILEETDVLRFVVIMSDSAPSGTEEIRFNSSECSWVSVWRYQ